jgi:uncharacterized protein YprB with RNaseH-like and TPR domain
MTYAVLDIETSSLYAEDNKTILDDVRTQMCTIGIAHSIGDELELTTLHLNEYEFYVDFMDAIADIFGDIKRPCKMITFNGESFDLKVLRTNMVENNVTAQVFRQMMHVDVYAHMIKPNIHLSRKKGAGTLKTWAERLLGFNYEMFGADFPKLYNAKANQAVIDMLVEYNQDDVKNTWEIYKRLVPFTPSYWLKGRGL